MALSETNIIRRFFTQRGVERRDISRGIGDDGAVLSPPPDHELVIVMDTLVEGVHFPRGTAARDIGHKALAVNLSDLAAMGAEPAWFTLSLTMPEVDETWLGGFSDGVFALAEEYRLQLVGGDTNHGPLSITIEAHGFVPTGAALYRNTARAGDLVYVTGTVGDAGLALAAILQGLELPPQVHEAVVGRLNRPGPRVHEGQALRDIAHAVIDVSDGLATDLGRILQASGVGASIEIERLPVSAWLRDYLPGGPGEGVLPWLETALCAGDDYELCFSIPREHQRCLEERFKALGCDCTCIGEIESAPGLRLRFGDGSFYKLDGGGYEHFY